MENSLRRQVENYFNAYETKDRSVVEAMLADNFSFSSPRDNHIPKTAYFERCWPQSNKEPVFTLQMILEKDHTVIILYDIKNNQGINARNMELFTFSEDKITSIEVFFGRGNHME